MPRKRRKPTENVPLRVLNQRNRARVAVAAPVKVARAESIAAAVPQQRKAFPAELSEELPKVRNDQGNEAGQT
jgi:hypothetical protein